MGRAGIAGGAGCTRGAGIAGSASRPRLAVNRVVMICSDNGDFVPRFDREYQLYWDDEPEAINNSEFFQDFVIIFCLCLARLPCYNDNNKNKKKYYSTYCSTR